MAARQRGKAAPQAATAELIVKRDRDVLWLTINRPEKRNALSLSLLGQVRAAIRGSNDSRLKLVVLGAAGDQAFAAGGDLHELSRYRSRHRAESMSKRARQTLAAIRRCPVPVIAAINGLALGGGAELAVACDFRLLGPQGRIGFVQGRLNVSTAWGGGRYLVDLLGPQKALLTLATSKLYQAEEALQIGLADAVTGPEETLDELLHRFMAPLLSQAPQVLRAFKAIAYSACASQSRREKLELHHLVATWVHENHWAAAARVFDAKSGRHLTAGN